MNLSKVGIAMKDTKRTAWRSPAGSPQSANVTRACAYSSGTRARRQLSACGCHFRNAKPQPPRCHLEHPRQHLNGVHPRHHSVSVEFVDVLPSVRSGSQHHTLRFELPLATSRYPIARFPM